MNDSPGEPLGVTTDGHRSAESRLQFRISDLLVVMVGAAVGLAGGTWIPADLFAAILGLVTLFGLLVVHLCPPRTRLLKVIWTTTVLAYVIAVFAALVKAW